MRWQHIKKKNTDKTNKKETKDGRKEKINKQTMDKIEKSIKLYKQRKKKVN